MPRALARPTASPHDLHWVSRRSALGALIALALLSQPPGCYADSVHAPEPTLTTPGAFVAVPFDPSFPGAGQAGEAGEGGAAGASNSSSDGTPASGGSSADDTELWQLIRVVAVFDTANDPAIFHFSYGAVASLEEAREATHLRSSGPPPYLSITSLGSLESADAVVVGYHSLTDEEKDSLR